MIAEADYALAHNAPFDKGVYEATCKRLGLKVSEPKHGWICTLQNVPWPKKYKCKRLAHLAYDHGIIEPPENLHRAYNDVALLSKLIIKNYSIEEIVEYRDSPWYYLRAQIPGPWVGNGGDGGVGRDQAKKLGYSYEKAYGTDAPLFPKCWIKRVKEKDLEKEKAGASFPIIELGVR